MQDRVCIPVRVQFYFKAGNMQSVLEYISHDSCQGKEICLLFEELPGDGWVVSAVKNSPTEIYNLQQLYSIWGPPQCYSGEESLCRCRNGRFDPGLGRPPGEGNDYPLQHSCLGIPVDRGAWWATVHGVVKTE